MALQYRMKITGLAEFQRFLKQAPAKAQRAMQQAVLESTKDLSYAVKLFVRKQLGRHSTGALANSFIPRVGRLYGEVGTNKVYARIHEVGGTIFPRVATFLTVPMSDAARRVRQTNTSLRSVSYYVVRKIHGDLFLFNTLTKSYDFALVREVNIPKRPYIRPTMDYIRPRFNSRMRANLKAVGLGS